MNDKMSSVNIITKFGMKRIEYKSNFICIGALEIETKILKLKFNLNTLNSF